VTYSTVNEGQDDLGVVLGSVVETLLALIPIFSHGSVTVWCVCVGYYLLCFIFFLAWSMFCSLDSLKFQSETGSARQLYQSIYGHYKHEVSNKVAFFENQIIFKKFIFSSYLVFHVKMINKYCFLFSLHFFFFFFFFFFLFF